MSFHLNINICVICNKELEEKYPHVFQCQYCLHIYRDYEGDNIEFHNSVYRKGKGLRHPNEMKNGKINFVNFHKNRMEIMKKRVNYVKQYLDISYDILDIGSGAGSFCLQIKDLVNNIECLEVCKELIDESDKYFKTYHQDFLTQEFSKIYNVVFAWHVLEHIPDITAFIKKCYDLTNKYVIIEIPTLISQDGKKKRNPISKLNPYPNFDGHYHYFNKTSLSLFLSKYFKIIEMKEGIQTPALFCVLEKI